MMVLERQPAPAWHRDDIVTATIENWIIGWSGITLASNG